MTLSKVGTTHILSQFNNTFRSGNVIIVDSYGFANFDKVQIAK